MTDIASLFDMVLKRPLVGLSVASWTIGAPLAGYWLLRHDDKKSVSRATKLITVASLIVAVGLTCFAMATSPRATNVADMPPETLRSASGRQVAVPQLPVSVDGAPGLGSHGTRRTLAPQSGGGTPTGAASGPVGTVTSIDQKGGVTAGTIGNVQQGTPRE